MADLTYTVSSGGTNSGTSWTTINGAWNDVKNNNRMGAGAGVIPASSTFYIKISGNFATDATLFGLDVTASGAAINIGANTNAWNASTANAAGKSTSFDGFNMGSSDTFGLYSSQGGVTIQDIVIVGAINGSVAIVDIGGNATYPVTVKNCIIVGTATGKVVALKAWNSTVVKNTVIFLSNASQTWRNDVAALINPRPRKTLGWRTPAEAMADEIAAFRSNVALDTLIRRLNPGTVDAS